MHQFVISPVIMLLCSGIWNMICAQALPVRFQKEKIEIDLNPGLMKLKGTYHIENTVNKHFGITFLYPLPVDEQHPFPTTYSVQGYQSWHDSTNIYWNMQLKPYQISSVSGIIQRQVHVPLPLLIYTETVLMWKTM